MENRNEQMRNENEILRVRLAQREDLDELLRIFASARVFMRKSGNPTQWGTETPTKSDVEATLSEKCCYVVETRDPADGSDATRISGTFVVRFGDDPMYATIYDGAWPSSAPYVTIHRLASDGTVKGIAETAFRFAEVLSKRATPPIHHVRIDTHRNNKPMLRKICDGGFEYCGIVHMPSDGTERLAFQKTL